MRVLLTALALLLPTFSLHAEDDEYAKILERAKASKPLAPQPKPAKVGPLTLEARIVKPAKDVFLSERVSKTVSSITSREDRLYISDYRKNIYGYKIDGRALSRDPDFGKDGLIRMKTDVEELLPLRKGQLAVVLSGLDGAIIKGDKVVTGHGLREESSLSELGYGGIWGLWPNDDEAKPRLVHRATRLKDNFVNKPWHGKGGELVTTQLITLDKSCVADDMILLSGTNAKYHQQLFALSLNGEPLFEFGEEQIKDKFTMSHMVALEWTGKHIIMVDGNMRQLLVLDHKGGLVGRTKLYDLTGLDYPWIAGASYNREHKCLYLCACNARKDSKICEAVVYEITGFE